MPALGPVLVYQDHLEGPVIAYLPDVHGAATALAGHGEFVQVLGEPAGMAYGYAGALFPGVQ